MLLFPAKQRFAVATGLSLLFLNLFALNSGCTPTKTPVTPTAPKPDSAKPGPKTPYYCGVHYFANEWPINFWSASHRDADTDFAAIRKDGFNTIILLIPWTEFQPGTAPIRYNERTLKRLTRLIEIARNHDLLVALRLGYTWDFYPNAQLPRTERFNKLFMEESVRNAWFRYVGKIADTVKPYENVSFGFMTWEDFWTYGGGALGLPEQERLQVSQKIGYSKWLKSKYTLEQYNALGKTSYASWEAVPIPAAETLGASSYLEFYDELLVQKLYKPTLEHFPNLSFEVRADGDPVPDSKGNRTYYMHKKTYDLPGGAFTTAYYNPAFAAQNKGDVSNADETIKRFQYLFSLLREGTKNPIFIDQFNFVDNTPGFEHNTRLAPAEIPAFLEKATPVFQEFTNGYALWAYHDYAANEIQNSSFVLGNEGWSLSGKATIHSTKKSQPTDELENILELAGPKATAVQTMAPYQQYYHGASPNITLSLKAQSVSATAHLRVVLGENPGVERTVSLKSTNGQVKVTFPANKIKSEILRIELLDGRAIIHEVKLYHFVQFGGVYKLDGTPYPARDAIVALNHRLIPSAKVPSP